MSNFTDRQLQQQVMVVKLWRTHRTPRKVARVLLDKFVSMGTSGLGDLDLLGDSPEVDQAIAAVSEAITGGNAWEAIPAARAEAETLVSLIKEDAGEIFMLN